MAGDPWRREEGKVPDGDGGRPTAGAGGPLRLRDWLVLQVESGSYPGLRWEDEGKTLFRIPWKHAAKQGYQAQQDAALFRAWAIHKGKHLEGTDKEDPSTWKTRLRCALNKSVDFREVRERSQLDISNPYKVYQLVSDSAHGPGTVLPLEAGSGLATKDEDREQPPRLAQQGSLAPAAWLLGPLADHRYQAQDPSHFWSPLPSEDFSNPVSVPVELRAHLQDGRPEPEYQIRLCFGEEYPGPPDQPQERLIMAHVEPVFARELLLYAKHRNHSAPVAVARPQSPHP
ncbi:Interferon regulatory factor 4 [Myotis brandtii]|uniref:Interferon regulatory factor 4 n=1 Tax=Myotis brandtii TaxID=109478 RepID=S7NFH2_MYOBR|nr:Interferon regulatory factor 4 [Myotis brandtii]